MARYRDEVEKALKTAIETIDKACPICKGDVNGNDTYLFYCKKCNILFKRDELFLENPERLRGIVEKKIIERYDRDKEKLNIEYETIKLKKLREIKRKYKNLHNVLHEVHKVAHRDIGSKKVYISSKSSNKLHVQNCPFAKNIKKSNREQFHSLAEANKHKRYMHCRCIDD